MATKRYSIDLIINTQQVQQAGQQAQQVQQQVQQGAQGVAGAVQGAVASVAKYVLGIQGIRMAWQESLEISRAYWALQTENADKQKNAAQKHLDFQRSLREAVLAGGGFTDPTVRKRISDYADNLERETGLQGQNAANFAIRGESDSAQYIKDAKNPRGHISPGGYRRGLMLAGRAANAFNIPGEEAAQLFATTLQNNDYSQEGNDEDQANAAFAQFMRTNVGLGQGRGRSRVNTEQATKFMSQFLSASGDGRVGGLTLPNGTVLTGQDVATIMLRMENEMSPEQSSAFGSRAVEATRNFASKTGGKGLKQAGVTLEDHPLIAMMKLKEDFDKQKAAGANEGTLMDVLRNKNRFPIRGAAGIGAIVRGIENGLMESAINAMAPITGATAPGMLGAATAGDLSLKQDIGRARGEVSTRKLGEPTAEERVLSDAATELFNTRYRPGTAERRGATERGLFGRLIYGEWDDEKAKEMLAWETLSRRINPRAFEDRYDPGSDSIISGAETMRRSYSLSGDDERLRMRQEAINRVGGIDEATKILQEQLEVLKKMDAKQQGQGVNMVAPDRAGGMIP